MFRLNAVRDLREQGANRVLFYILSIVARCELLFEANAIPMHFCQSFVTCGDQRLAFHVEMFGCSIEKRFVHNILSPASGASSVSLQ